jgi:pilus assembly protein Flp/PilA
MIAAARHALSHCLALRGDRRAVTAIEYALIAALIAVVIIGAVTTLGANATATFNTVASEL